jgi:HEAT repeat protein
MTALRAVTPLVCIGLLSCALQGRAARAADQDDFFSVKSLTHLVVTNDQNSRYNREWACRMLAGTEPAPVSALPALIDAMRDASRENEDARAACAHAIGKLGPDAAPAIDALVSVLDEDSESIEYQQTHDVRAHGATSEEVIKVLGLIGPAAIPPLVSRLDFRPDAQGENSNPAWGAAARALALIGPPAVPALLSALKDPAKREAAIDALGYIGPAAARESVPALTALCGSPDVSVRRRAVSALQDIGEPATQAVPALIRALDDPDGLVRFRAVLALGAIGLAAAAAVPALKGRLASGHLSASERTQTEAALRKIEGR